MHALEKNRPSSFSHNKDDHHHRSSSSSSTPNRLSGCPPCLSVFLPAPMYLQTYVYMYIRGLHTCTYRYLYICVCYETCVSLRVDVDVCGPCLYFINLSSSCHLASERSLSMSERRSFFLSFLRSLVLGNIGSLELFFSPFFSSAALSLINEQMRWRAEKPHHPFLLFFGPLPFCVSSFRLGLRVSGIALNLRARLHEWWMIYAWASIYIYIYTTEDACVWICIEIYRYIDICACVKR